MAFIQWQLLKLTKILGGRISDIKSYNFLLKKKSYNFLIPRPYFAYELVNLEIILGIEILSKYFYQLKVFTLKLSEISI